VRHRATAVHGFLLFESNRLNATLKPDSEELGDFSGFQGGRVNGPRARKNGRIRDLSSARIKNSYFSDVLPRKISTSVLQAGGSISQSREPVLHYFISEKVSMSNR
jgi:hypothetical protein